MRQKQDVFLSVFAVALLAEGVDRNLLNLPETVLELLSRPPRGGRG